MAVTFLPIVTETSFLQFANPPTDTTLYFIFCSAMVEGITSFFIFLLVVPIHCASFFLPVFVTLYFNSPVVKISPFFNGAGVFPDFYGRRLSQGIL